MTTDHFTVLKSNVTALVHNRLLTWTSNLLFLNSTDLVEKAVEEMNIIGLSSIELSLLKKQVNSSLTNRSKDAKYRITTSLVKVVGPSGKRGIGFCYVPEGKMIQVRAANIQLVKSGGLQHF